MKTILLASALLIGGTAYAQADPRDAGQPIGSDATMQPGTTMGERDTMGPPPVGSTPQDTTTPTDMAPPPPATGTMDSTTTGTMDSTTTGTTGTMDSTTGSTMGTTGSGAIVMQQGGNVTPPPEPRGEYPRCSRTVTDNCVQDESRARDTRRPR